MKELFQQIENVLRSLHGWAELDKAISLSAYVLALKPNTVVEIGVWGGRSAIPMMLACQRLNRGKVICIDPWKPEESAKGQDSDIDQKWWGSQNHELVFQHFSHTIERLGLMVHCEIWRMPSHEARPPAEIDLLHVDGNHGPQALEDVKSFAPSVRPYGICVLDDLGWTGGNVLKAEQWLLENGFIKLHPLGSGAVYLRVK